MGGADGVAIMRSVGREEEQGDGCFAVAVLTDLEREINGSVIFCDFDFLDTRVSVCNIRKQRLVHLTMEVHRHEIHEVHVQMKG